MLERRGLAEFPDGLPLSFGDVQSQGVVEPIDQVYGLVEVFAAGHKSCQHHEFEELAGLDAFDGLAGALESLAAKVVYGRTNAAVNTAKAHSDAER